VKPRIKTPISKNESRQHAFTLGQAVNILPRASTRTSRAVEQSLHSSHFKIVRLLPEEGVGFQYRVQNAETSQERVVAECEISPADI
jgi:hypothetical protein